LIATNIELTTIPNPNAPVTTPPRPLEQQPDASAPVNSLPQGPAISAPEEDGEPENAPSQASTRAIIQNLTLPTVPNFDIPASPPGSPPIKATKKFLQFLELKTKGQHFNQRLEASSVLRDPRHLQRLMEFAGISVEDSHATTLSEEVAIPVAFPEWAYAEELRASQKNIFTSREQAKSKNPRETVGFVPAAKSGTLNGTRTPAGKGLQQQNAAERVIASLDKQESNYQNTSKRKTLEHRGRDESSRNGPNRESRSPKRKRSSSRGERG